MRCEKRHRERIIDTIGFANGKDKWKGSIDALELRPKTWTA